MCWSEDDQQYEVEKIIRHQFIKSEDGSKTLNLRIKWVGSKNSTWEPIQTMWNDLG